MGNWEACGCQLFSLPILRKENLRLTTKFALVATICRGPYMLGTVTCFVDITTANPPEFLTLPRQGNFILELPILSPTVEAIERDSICFAIPNSPLTLKLLDAFSWQSRTREVDGSAGKGVCSQAKLGLIPRIHILWRVRTDSQQLFSGFQIRYVRSAYTYTNTPIVNKQTNK